MPPILLQIGAGKTAAVRTCRSFVKTRGAVAILNVRDMHRERDQLVALASHDLALAVFCARAIATSFRLTSPVDIVPRDRYRREVIRQERPCIARRRNALRRVPNRAKNNLADLPRQLEPGGRTATTAHSSPVKALAC